MGEGPGDAGPQNTRHAGDQRRAETTPDDVDPQRERQPGLLQPVNAEVGHEVEAAGRVEQPPLVNQQRRVDLADRQRIEDSVERGDWNLDPDRARRDETEHQPGRGARARDPDPHPGQVGRRERARRHDHGTVAPPHRRPVRQQLIAGRDGRVDAKRNGDHIRGADDCQAVERRGVVAVVGECQPIRVDGRRPQRVKHKGIVGVHRIGKRD